MSNTLPNLPAAPELPPVKGALSRPSQASLSSEMPMQTAGGLMLRSLEDALKLAAYLVDQEAAPKDWTPGMVFLATQAGLEHGLGITGGMQAFVVVDNQLMWRGKAALAKMRTSKVLVPGSLDMGTEPDPDAPGKIRGFCKARRVGDSKDTFRYFTEADAKAAGLSTKQNYTKYLKRMLQWRPVGFIGSDLFSDVLGGFPIADAVVEAFDEQGNVPPSRRTVSILSTTPSLEAAADPLLAEVSGGSAEPPTTADVIDVLTEDDIEAQLKKSIAAHEAAMGFADGLEKGEEG